MLRVFCLCSLGGLLFPLAGCGPRGPRVYDVSGTATFDGKPIENGDIIFLAADGQVSPDAGKIVDGKFQVRVKEGSKKVEIRATKEIGRTSMGALYDDYIPSKYNGQTTLTAQIPTTDGSNHLEFDLKSDSD